jgi:hypothetical protein
VTAAWTGFMGAAQTLKSKGSPNQLAQVRRILSVDDICVT